MLIAMRRNRNIIGLCVQNFRRDDAAIVANEGSQVDWLTQVNEKNKHYNHF